MTNKQCDHLWVNYHEGKIKHCIRCDMIQYEYNYVRENLEEVLLTAEKFNIKNLIRDCKNYQKSLNMKNGSSIMSSTWYCEENAAFYLVTDDFVGADFVGAIAENLDREIMNDYITDMVTKMMHCTCGSNNHELKEYSDIVVITCKECGKVEVIQ